MSVRTLPRGVILLLAFALILSVGEVRGGPGHVLSREKISDTSFPPGTVEDLGQFGASVTYLGDLGAGAPTPRALAVGAPLPGATAYGSVYILFLNADGTVNSYIEITDNQGGFPTGLIGPADAFGYAMAALGDLGAGAPPPTRWRSALLPMTVTVRIAGRCGFCSSTATEP
jgi:hypothetical protein